MGGHSGLEGESNDVQTNCQKLALWVLVDLGFTLPLFLGDFGKII